MRRSSLRVSVFDLGTGWVFPTVPSMTRGLGGAERPGPRQSLRDREAARHEITEGPTPLRARK